ncbi:MAG: SGNH/GDSL hydrolase family protein [Rikenellaceae bacterium]
MMRQITFIVVLLIVWLPRIAVGQELVWHNPQEAAFNPIEGQFWQGEERAGFYNRFPDSFKELVRESVWRLSTNSAGLSIRFRTNSPKITVRYNLTDSLLSLNHMPKTGSSGVDLYRYDSAGDMLRVAGRFAFNEDVAYTYTSLNSHDMTDPDGYLYHLYLPLYNGVKRMQIGVEEGSYFEFIEPRTEDPIVVYGTSITQGACASRPAMAWSSIVSRELNMPLYNFGFSGNGKLEDAIVDMISQIDASIYLLDCMPNLQHSESAVITELVCKAVHTLRERHPKTPIVLTDHLGYSDQAVVDRQRGLVDNCLVAQKRAYDMLIEEGVEDLYYLSSETLSFTPDAIVDYVHPSDYGMMIYADAYNELIRSILGL